ncbi:unnamed protein product, partial [Rotaria magnacalcarata]
ITRFLAGCSPLFTAVCVVALAGTCTPAASN